MRVQDEKGKWRQYPPSFANKDKAILEIFVQQHSMSASMRDLSKLGTTDAISIRHDVDHSIDHAVKFARWERERGIRSTYFVLHSAYYYIDKANLYEQMRKIIAYSHEIGLHLDTVNQNTVDGVPDYDAAATLLENELAVLRNEGFDIVGSAAHGGIRTDLELFDGRYQLGRFGLEYEAYDLQRKLRANYISDNHGKWQSPLVKKPDQITIMSIHPEHWAFD